MNKFVQQCIALKVTSGLATKMTEMILRITTCALHNHMTLMLWMFNVIMILIIMWILMLVKLLVMIMMGLGELVSTFALLT